MIFHNIDSSMVDIQFSPLLHHAAFARSSTVDPFASWTNEADIPSLLRLSNHDCLFIEVSVWSRVSDDGKPYAGDNFSAKLAKLGLGFYVHHRLVLAREAIRTAAYRELPSDNLELVGGEVVQIVSHRRHMYNSSFILNCTRKQGRRASFLCNHFVTLPCFVSAVNCFQNASIIFV